MVGLRSAALCDAVGMLEAWDRNAAKEGTDICAGGPALPALVGRCWYWYCGWYCGWYRCCE
jgi:hypothetical protein